MRSSAASEAESAWLGLGIRVRVRFWVRARARARARVRVRVRIGRGPAHHLDAVEFCSLSVLVPLTGGDGHQGGHVRQQLLGRLVGAVGVRRERAWIGFGLGLGLGLG